MSDDIRAAQAVDGVLERYRKWAAHIRDGLHAKEDAECRVREDIQKMQDLQTRGCLTLEHLTEEMLASFAAYTRTASRKKFIGRENPAEEGLYGRDLWYAVEGCQQELRLAREEKRDFMDAVKKRAAEIIAALNPVPERDIRPGSVIFEITLLPFAQDSLERLLVLTPVKIGEDYSVALAGALDQDMLFKFDIVSKDDVEEAAPAALSGGAAVRRFKASPEDAIDEKTFFSSRGTPMASLGKIRSFFNEHPIFVQAGDAFPPQLIRRRVDPENPSEIIRVTAAAYRNGALLAQDVLAMLPLTPPEEEDMRGVLPAKSPEAAGATVTFKTEP